MKLSQWKERQRIPSVSCAISPGNHCPLFGVGAALKAVDGVTILYVGTNDCVYYAQKNLLSRYHGNSPSRPRVVSAMLTDQDLIFGIEEELGRLIDREAEREGVRSLFVVTSCAVEVISEDLEGLVRRKNRQYACNIQLIQTENFKTADYFVGIENAMAALIQGLEAVPKDPKLFHVLGARYPGSAQLEPAVFLKQQGFRLGTAFPFACGGKELKTLPASSLNLVVEGSGLAAAEECKRRFGTEYVRFDEKMHLAALQRAYERLAQLTGADVSVFLQEKLRETERLEEEVSALVRGKTFCYGQTMMYPFDTCAYLVKLGMIPRVILVGTLLDRDSRAQQEILSRWDPEVWKNAGYQATLKLLEREKPDYFIGALKGQCEAIQVAFRNIPVDCGFAFLQKALSQIREKGENRL